MHEVGREIFHKVGEGSDRLADGRKYTKDCLFNKRSYNTGLPTSDLQWGDGRLCSFMDQTCIKLYQPTQSVTGRGILYHYLLNRQLLALEILNPLFHGFFPQRA